MKLAQSFRLFACTAVAIFLAAPSAEAEFIDIDLTNLDPATTTAATLAAFEGAEAFWESRVLGYSNTIPSDIRPNLTGRLTITVFEQDFGGGILATGGVLTSEVSSLGGRNREVATTSVMNFDPNTIADFSQDDLQDVVIHEMGHALGFGTLWEGNDLIQAIPQRGGILQYRGINARRTFAQEAGFNRPQVGFVPVEQEGAAGTALGHWDDDNFFFNSQNINNRVELMTGFFIDNTERFISETTFASLVDLGYVVSGFNDDELIDFVTPVQARFPVRSSFNNRFAVDAALTLSGGAASVPEPSSLSLFLAGISGLLLRRRRDLG